MLPSAGSGSTIMPRHAAVVLLRVPRPSGAKSCLHLPRLPDSPALQSSGEFLRGLGRISMVWRFASVLPSPSDRLTPFIVGALSLATLAFLQCLSGHGIPYGYSMDSLLFMTRTFRETLLGLLRNRLSPDTAITSTFALQGVAEQVVAGVRPTGSRRRLPRLGCRPRCLRTDQHHS